MASFNYVVMGPTPNARSETVETGRFYQFEMVDMFVKVLVHGTYNFMSQGERHLSGIATVIDRPAGYY